MVDPIPNMDSEFSAQLQALVIEAEQSRDAELSAHVHAPRPTAAPDVQSLVRRVLDSMESLHRSQNEQLATLDRLDRLAAASESVPQTLAETKQSLESRNTVSKAMFEALHTELKTYKDAFILESVLRPVIRDLISVYDDMADIHRQLTLTITSFDEREAGGSTFSLLENMRQAVMNLDHNTHFILEVLERLDVTLVPLTSEKLDKRTQKAMSVETTDDPARDQEIVKVLKRGFVWKDRPIRPEEVVIKKWKESPAGNSETLESHV